MPRRTYTKEELESVKHLPADFQECIIDFMKRNNKTAKAQEEEDGVWSRDVDQHKGDLFARSNSRDGDDPKTMDDSWGLADQAKMPKLPDIGWNRAEANADNSWSKSPKNVFIEPIKEEICEDKLNDDSWGSPVKKSANKILDDDDWGDVPSKVGARGDAWNASTPVRDNLNDSANLDFVDLLAELKSHNQGDPGRLPSEADFTRALNDLNNKDLLDLVKTSENMPNSINLFDMLALTLEQSSDRCCPVIINRLMLVLLTVTARQDEELIKTLLKSNLISSMCVGLSKQRNLTKFIDFPGIVMDLLFFMPRIAYQTKSYFDLIEPYVVGILIRYMKEMYNTEILEHIVMALTLIMEASLVQGKFRLFITDFMFREGPGFLSRLRRYKNQNLTILANKFQERFSDLSKTVPHQRPRMNNDDCGSSVFGDSVYSMDTRASRNKTEPVKKGPSWFEEDDDDGEPKKRFQSSVSGVESGLGTMASGTLTRDVSLIDLTDNEDSNVKAVSQKTKEPEPMELSGMCLCFSPLVKGALLKETRKEVVKILKNNYEWRMCVFCIKVACAVALENPEEDDVLSEYLADSLRMKLSSMITKDKPDSLSTGFLRATSTWPPDRFIKEFSGNISNFGI